MSLENLRNTDYTLIIDRSGSMVTADMPGGKTRWDTMKESTYAVAAHVFQLDTDGLDIRLFSGFHRYYRNVTPEKVKEIFMENSPMGNTDLAGVLKAALDNFFEQRAAGQLKSGGETMIVITDGQPDDEKEVKEVLTAAVKRLRPDDKLAIQFLQVGKDEGATRFLKFLDDELTKERGVWKDVVSTVSLETIERIGLNEVLLDLVTTSAKVA